METAPEQKEAPASLRDGFRGVWRLVRPYRRLLGFISVLGVISAIANGFVPYVTGRLFDALIALPNHNESNGIALWLTFLILWGAIRVLSDLIDWLIDRKKRWLYTNIQPGTVGMGMAHLLLLPISFHINQRIHEMTERIQGASWRVATIAQTTVEVAPQFLSIIIGIALAYTINHSLAWVLVTGVIAYIIALTFLLRGSAELNTIAHKAWARAWDDSHAAISQAIAVKQATAEKHELAHIRATWQGSVIKLWFENNELIWNRVNLWQRIIVFLTQLSVFVLSIQYILSGSLTVGELIALNGYALMFFGPLVMFGSTWQVIQNGVTAAGALEKILQNPKENYHPENARMSGDKKGEVKFEDVVFRYETGDEVLSHLSFAAEPGQSIALVGESGVGKSTAIALISGYYFPTAGRVLVDGVDTREWDLLALRSRIAVVPQEVALFNDTVRANICYGSFDASDEEVERAAMEAHIHDFVMKLPKQYDTLVGERGIKLSVGQKQRVAIARAILRNPEFLILDEPTSALDIETEQLITGSLEKLMKGRTTFIIAHRLSTVRKADQILVIKDGTIAEQGGHAELIERPDGIYKKLYELHVGLHE